MKTYSISANKIFKKLGIFIFWLAVWQAIAMAVNLELLLPTPLRVVKTWYQLVKTNEFWMSSVFTLLRVLVGFLLGVVFGAGLGFITAKFKTVSEVFSPVLHIIKSTPVASFVILALIFIKTDYLPVFVSFLVVVPMVWETTKNSILNIDKKLLEMADIFSLSKLKRLLYITIPSIFPQFITTCVTALGFSWKSGVAAEVISLPEISLGKLLYNSKIMFETAEVFSITATTIILSVIFEALLKAVVKKYIKKGEVKYD